MRVLRALLRVIAIAVSAVLLIVAVSLGTGALLAHQSFRASEVIAAPPPAPAMSSSLLREALRAHQADLAPWCSTNALSSDLTPVMRRYVARARAMLCDGTEPPRLIVMDTTTGMANRMVSATL